MIILPAIDIKDGKCVRLVKGDFDQSTEYKKSPLDQSIEFSDLGFKNIHIIDLDGALEGKLINKNIIEKIIKKNNLNIQVGGGVRTLKNIEEWINIGVDKVIIGTAAVDNINFLQEACSQFKNRIALAIDVRAKLIALSGWKKQTNISAIDFAQKIKNFGVSRIIYTDINKDGTKKGPNIDDTIDFSKKINISTIVSGGISSISDIANIKKLNSLKIEGVIVGKAIYDKSINLKELSKLI